MDLPAYIKETGVEQLARRLSKPDRVVKPRAVQAWMYGTRYPRKETAFDIVHDSGGRVTLAEIYRARA